MKYFKIDEMKDIPLIHYMFSIICQTFIYIFHLKELFWALNECKDELDTDFCLKEFAIK